MWPVSRLLRFVVLAWLVALIGLNLRSLREGLAYLRQMWHWRPDEVVEVRRDGRFGDCYSLVALDNAGRAAYVREQLSSRGIQYHEQAVPGETLPNFFIRLGPPGPMTLFVAHYDKSRETPTYQGASDNTAAVVALLAALRELASHAPAQPVGILFSAAEERGYLGAKAFLAQTQAATIREVVNCDMLGRDRIAIRPSALPGFYVYIPLIGWFAYDGRRIRRGNTYSQPDPQLVARVRAALGSKLVVYQRFTASSDSNVFQAAGFPTVSLSSDNIFYLDSIWERDSDRVELLDEDHLTRAWHLILHLAHD